MNGDASVFGDLNVIGGVLCLVIAGWMTLTLISGLTKRRINLLVFSLQLLGFLYLFRDVAMPLIAYQFEWRPEGVRPFLTALVVISSGFLFDRLWRHFIWDGVLVAGGGAPPPRLARGCFTALVMLLASAVVVGWVYGQSITGLIAASGVVAVVLGYAAQSVLGDLLAGMSMAASPVFKIGDVLEVDGGWYEVVDQNWRVTETLGRDGRRVYFPNSVLIKKPFANITGQKDPLRHPFRFSADANTPPSVISEAIDEAMGQSKLTDKRRKHFTSFTGYSEFGHEVTLYYFTEERQHWPAQPEIANLLWYAFKKRGVAFSYNRSHAYLTDWDRAERIHGASLIEADPEAEEFRAACQGVEEFSGLEADEVERLRARAELRVFGKHERVIAAGEESGSVFLLVRGALDAFVEIEGAESKVATIEAPSLVGFMALAMNQPRSATLRAGAPCLTYEVSAADFAAFADEDPEVMEKLLETSARMALDNEKSKAEGAMSAAQEQDRMKLLKDMFRSRLSDLLRAG
ncbi:MAG: cyclic nucleotide-binding domain-containing protein [Pikeienuella sp.]